MLPNKKKLMNIINNFVDAIKPLYNKTVFLINLLVLLTTPG